MDDDEAVMNQKLLRKSTRSRKFLFSDSMFHAWHCFSLVLRNKTTVDFVVQDNEQLMSILHIL